MRWLGAVLIALLPLFLLFQILSVRRQRLRGLLQVERLIDFVREEIRYANREKGEIFKMLYALDISDAYLHMLSTLGGGPIPENAAKNYRGGLLPEDLTLVSRFYNSIGQSDTKGQLKQCDYYSYLVRKTVLRQQAEYKQKCKLYSALFAALSAFIFIILC